MTDKTDEPVCCERCGAPLPIDAAVFETRKGDRPIKVGCRGCGMQWVHRPGIGWRPIIRG